MLKEVGACPQMIMELSGLTDEYKIHSEEELEEWSEVKEEASSDLDTVVRISTMD